MEIEHRDEGEIFEMGHKGENLQGGQKKRGVSVRQGLAVYKRCIPIVQILIPIPVFPQYIPLHLCCSLFCFLCPYHA